MAGNYDRYWNKSKGTRSQFRLEGLQPFKCTYPVHLTDIMDVGQSSQSNSQRTEFQTSPFKETQTKAVREYEENIDQLRKENFDLKVRLFLCEEAHKETYHVKSSYNNEKEDCIQIIVNLRIETEDLKKKLDGKDEEMQSVVNQFEGEVQKYKLELSEKDEKINEQTGILEKLPTLEDYHEAVEQITCMVNESEFLKQSLAEKNEEIDNANLKIKELEDKIVALNKKVKTRDEAIKRCALKYHEETDHIPKHLRPVIKNVFEAAVKNDETKLFSSMEELKKSLSEIIGVPIPSKLQSNYLGDSHSKNSSVASSSRSSNSSVVKDSSASDDSFKDAVHDHSGVVEGNLDGTEIASSNLPISQSDRTIQCNLGIQKTESSDLEVENLNIMLELKSQLGEAFSKINYLENELEKRHNLVAYSSEKDNSSCQTDIIWNSLQSRLSDKNLQELGTSNSISELKEEILMLVLAIEQKDKELSDFHQTLAQYSIHTPLDEGYAAERDVLQHRLAISCSINNELLRHLQSLERFMEDLLQKNNFSASSFENINESADFFARLSSCLDQSLKCSRTLSDQLSICENSRFFEGSDTTMPRSEFNVSDRKSIGRSLGSQFSQEESDIPYIYQEGRGNFYSSIKENHNILDSGKLSEIYSSQQLLNFAGKKQSTDSLNLDNVVVLKTSNNEDLILLLNDQGDPKDVLIRNNSMYSKETDQHRRRCWDAPTNQDFWDSEKFAAQCKENVYSVENRNVFKSNYMRNNVWMSSDSDTWSEPDRNVSMQRIGIDVQTSPITSRSPRKSRFKDRRAAEDSTKNESASSCVKLHSFSKRRRSSDTSKWSFTCKKCYKQSQQFDDTLQEGRSTDNLQELQQLCDENSNQKNKIEDLTGELITKEKLIDSLNEEKNNLAVEINVLKEKLTELQKSNTEKDSLNEGLESIVESLEFNKKNSDAAFEKLQTELNQTKERLIELDKRCAKYDQNLSSYAQEKTEYEEKLSQLEQREKELLESIKDMISQKDSLLDKLKKEEKYAENAKKENSEMTERVKASNQEIFKLKNSIEKLKELNDSLQNAKTLVEKNLESSNFEKDALKFEVKSLKETNANLKSNSNSFEAEIQFLTNSKQNIIELLSNFESCFALNLKILSEVCDMKSDLDIENFEVVEKMSFLVDESEQVHALLKNIIIENLKFKKLLFDISQKIEKIQDEKQYVIDEKHQLEKEIMLKEGEIKDLCDEIKKLQAINDDINALHNAAVAFKTDHELLEKQNSLLEQKEINIKTLEKRNHDLKEILQKERSSSHHALDTANLKICSLEEQLKEVEKVKSDHELLEKHKSLLEEKESHMRTYEKKNHELEEHIKFLLNEKKSYEQALESAKADVSSSREHFVALEKSNENYKNMIKTKQEDLDKLQKRIVSLQSQITELLGEKINLSQEDQSKLKEIPEKAMSPDSSTIIEVPSNSHLQSVSKVDCDNSYSSEKSMENDLIISSNTTEKYVKSIKSLQKELKAANKRIEMLEKEKNSLRENLLSYVHNSKRTSSEKAENNDFKADKQADLKSKLETKQSFIEELKAHLYNANDSLIDKQKEVDNLKRELLKFKRSDEDKTRTLLHIPGRLSDAFLLNTETSNNDLRKQKKELMNSLLGLQKQFYEAKNIHLDHFEKFIRHIDNLRSLQVSPSLLKSESAPVLNSPLMSNFEQSRKWERALKNAQIDLEVDIECFQNLKIFLNRFFAPIMSQSSTNQTKENKAVQTDLQKETLKSFRSRDTSKFPSKSFCSSGEQLQMEREEPSHDRLATTASTISLKLDWIESMLKTVIEEFEQLSGMESIINESTRETSAKSILLKLFDRLESLQENANEIFYMNSRLKSLKLFDNDRFHHSSNISDHESLLSDETIALSRSVSISPVSFDGQFVPGYHKLKGRSLIHSYIKQSEEIKRSPLRPSHKVISSSQDSIFQRTHDSSPDLGIESDPNHEHSAPEQTDKFHSTKIGASKQDLSGSAMYRNLDKQRLSSIHNFSGSSFMFKDKSLPFLVSDTLHAIGNLQDYELLKKEISESIVGIKSILSRTGDGMQQITCNTSPRKLQSLEFSTFKAIKDTCMNIDVCLRKADKLVNNFWVAACPTEDELRQLRQLNEELNSKMIQLYESKKKQEIEYNGALDRLKQAEIYNEKQEQKISRKLVKTKNILRVAEKKILETRNREQPMSAKGSSRMSVNP